MRIVEVTEKKSKAIFEYIQQLSDLLSNNNNQVVIRDWNTALINFSGDIYHYHYSNSTTKVIFPLLLHLNRKNIVTVHDIIPRNKIWRQILSPFFYRIIDLSSKKIIVHSKHAKELLLNNFSFISTNKVSIIPYGTVLFVEKKKENNEKPILSNTIKFLYVGYLKKTKGVRETIEAFKRIKNPNINLYLIGKCIDKELQQYILNIRDKRIKYLGALSNKQLSEWLSKTDSVVNFRSDTVGETSASVINSINFGKPILATNIGSNPEVINNAGLLCDFNILDISSVMKDFSSNSLLRSNLQKAALKRRKELQWERLYPQYKEIFNI